MVVTETAGITLAPEAQPLVVAPRPPQLPAPRIAVPPQRSRRLRLGFAASVAKALEQRRFFTLLPFAVIAGLVTYVSAGSEPQSLVLWGVGIVAVIALIVSIRSIAIFRAVGLFAAFWFGFSLLAVHGAVFGTTMLGYSAYGTFTMTVDDVISEQAEVQRVIVSHVVPDADTKPVPLRRARLFVRNGAKLRPGDVIAGKVRFYPTPGPAVPGSYDAQFNGYFDGIGAYATTIGPLAIVSAGSAPDPERLISGIRTDIADRIDAVLAQPAAGIARSIVNGDQSAVTEQARDTMADAGLAHVLSISGLHLTLVAGGVFVIVRLLLAASHTLLSLPVKRLAALAAIAAATLYYSISGGNVAALRSTIMIILVFGATIVGRRALTMRNVAIAALAVIVTDPSGVFGPSFQLSFSAVVALVGAYEMLRPRSGKDGRLRRLIGYFTGIGTTSLIAGAATVLFSIYHFQQTSPLSVLANLIALPLVGIVMMPAALVSVLAMPFGFERWPLIVMGWSVDRMLDSAALVAHLSEHLRASPLLTPLSLIIGLAALAWFSFLPDRWRLLGPVLAIPLVICLAVDRPPDILVADSTRALAVRVESGLALADGKPGSFAVTVWGDTYGAALQPVAATQKHCDELGCLFTGAAGFRVAEVLNPAAFPEDCESANLVVTHDYAPGYCRAETTVIDAIDLRRGGVHWLRWLGDRFEIRPAVADLNRPWRAAPR
jgi:competence protein ComEC